MNSPATTAISDGRVMIRPISMDDVNQTYVDWLRDPEVNQYLETRHTEQTLASVGDFVRAMIASPDQHLFAICLDDKHVGNIKVGPVKQPHLLADVSLFIGDRDAWGKGVATAAIRLISRFAILTLGLKKLNAGVYGPNIGSAKAFLGAGYTQEGLRRRHYKCGSDMVDAFEFGLCAEDLDAKNKTNE
ncbi:MAG: GNAT family N-acetyltransferase [Rhodospirillaceae bacterium]|nr:GNAT family N-acetyltransferase [Rhodospirillaceae bacterium]